MQIVILYGPSQHPPSNRCHSHFGYMLFVFWAWQGFCEDIASAKRNSSYSTYSILFLTYTSYFGGKKGISRNKMIFFFLMWLFDFDLSNFDLFFFFVLPSA